MSARKTILLRRIISNFATPTQMRRYDELVSVNKGSASHFAFRLLEEYFEKKDTVKTPQESRENTQEAPRLFKINGYGKTWYSK
jgi:hypothetical protein